VNFDGFSLVENRVVHNHPIFAFIILLHYDLKNKIIIGLLNEKKSTHLFIGWVLSWNSKAQ